MGRGKIGIMRVTGRKNAAAPPQVSLNTLTEVPIMALANLAEWNEEKKVATWAQPNVSACGAGDETNEENPAACGSACGAGDEKKEEKPSACGSACGAGDGK